MRPSLKLYHGGIRGFVPGQTLLPPSLTGARSCADYDDEHCRADRVYLTSDPADAAVYAALAPGAGGGDVYEVEPVGELEPDPPGEVDTDSYAAAAATVVATVRCAIPLDEAVASMAAFLLRLGADDAAALKRATPPRRNPRAPAPARGPDHPLIRLIADAFPRSRTPLRVLVVEDEDNAAL